MPHNNHSLYLVLILYIIKAQNSLQQSKPDRHKETQESLGRGKILTYYRAHAV
jgi:hypothetical protein